MCLCSSVKTREGSQKRRGEPFGAAGRFQAEESVPLPQVSSIPARDRKAGQPSPSCDSKHGVPGTQDGSGQPRAPAPHSRTSGAAFLTATPEQQQVRLLRRRERTGCATRNRSGPRGGQGISLCGSCPFLFPPRGHGLDGSEPLAWSPLWRHRGDVWRTIQVTANGLQA